MQGGGVVPDGGLGHLASAILMVNQPGIGSGIGATCFLILGQYSMFKVNMNIIFFGSIPDFCAKSFRRCVLARDDGNIGYERMIIMVCSKKSLQQWDRYPLVNVYITMEKTPFFMGKSTIIDHVQ